MIRAFAISVSAPLLFLLAGAALQGLLPRRLEESRAAIVGYSYLLGTAYVGLALWALSYVVNVPIAGPTVWSIVLAPVALVLARFAWARRANGHDAPFAAWRGVGLEAAAVAAVIGIATAALLAETLIEPVTDYDGQMIWGTAAKFIAASETVLPAALLDEHVLVAHPRYPVLLPLLQVAAVQLSGEGFEGHQIRPLYVLFLPALALVFWPALRRSGGPVAAALSLLLVLSVPCLLWNRDVGARGTYSDLPLACYLGAALVVLHDRRSATSWSRGVVAGVLFAACAGAKNEGLVLSIAALSLSLLTVGGGLLTTRGKLRWRVPRAALGAACILGLALSMIVSWRAQIPNRRDEAYFELASVERVVSGLAERQHQIALAVWERLRDPDGWGLALAGVLALTLLGATARRLRAQLPLLLLLSLHCLLGLAAYAVVRNRTTIAVTFDRLVLQMIGPLCLVCVQGAAGSLRRRRGRLAPLRSDSESPPTRSRTKPRGSESRSSELGLATRSESGSSSRSQPGPEDGGTTG